MKKPTRRKFPKPKILPDNPLEAVFVERSPEGVRHCLETAGRAVDEGKFYLARQLMDKARQQARSNAGVIMSFGRFQMAIGETDVALEAFQEAVELEPELYTANTAIGEALLVYSMYADARYAFRCALELNNRYLPALLGIALALEKLGKYKRGMLALKTALAVKPGAFLISKRLARLTYLSSGQKGLMDLLKDPRCNMAYNVMHQVAKQLVDSGYVMKDPKVRSLDRCFRSYLQETSDCDEEETGRIANLNLLSNLHYPDYHWRERALSHYPRRMYQKWVRIDGLENYSEAIKRGRGVILVMSHFSPGWVSTLTLDRLGVSTTSIVFRDALGNMGVRFWNQQNILPLEGRYNAQYEHLEAMRSLKKQGTVVVSGDAYMGGDMLDFPFMGRSRGFRPGFAGLAAATGAPLLPLFTSMDRQGRITVTVQPELKPDRQAGRKERVRKLVQQYVDRLENHWRAHPGNLPWEYVARIFCKQLARDSKPHKAAG